MKKLPLILILICLALLSACQSRAETPETATVFAMDTVMSLKAYGPNADGGLSAAKEVLRSLDRLLSVTDEGSEVYAVNHAEGGGSALSPHTSEVISGALDICALTGGALDITVYPLVKAWGFTMAEPSIPNDGTIADLLRLVGYENLKLEGGILTAPSGVEIDLGAVAKGFAGDKVLEAMAAAGVTDALVDLGGNVQAMGQKPGGGKWQIAVQDPASRENYLCRVEIDEGAVITSGGYNRYFEGPDGEVYWHIIDPATGRPAKSGLVSVTVLGPSGLVCDGLSTAVFVLGRDAAVELWRQNGGFQMILVSDSGTVTATAGLKDSFTLVSQDYTLEWVE